MLGLNLNILIWRGLLHEIVEDFLWGWGEEIGVFDRVEAGLGPEFIGVVVVAGEAAFH